ncbi:MAG TPA: FtsW/RodA/SpoVE family cell cycle protein [Candidatus Fimivicinus intestinavium]|nr:FtsW/RodA/SpoVE family cell cycle protein [Candidatus Fimivicinus intestinavium]
MQKFRSWFKLYFRETDKLLFFLCLCASAFGMLLVYSATKSGSTTAIPPDLRTMLMAVGMGLLLCLVISFLDYEVIIRLWPLIALFCILIMCALFVWGVAPNARQDARSWLDLKVFYFQPSELVKIGFIITFAVHLDAVRDHVSKFKTVLLLGVHGLIPIGLVVATGDDGSALIFFLMFLGMMFAAGVHWGYFAAGFAAVAVAFPAIWALGDKFILNQDQKNRFLAILYPELYAKSEAFQQNRGIGAIGSGQLFGQGLFEGSYTQSGAVPESENDFIFTVAAEEFGFIGAMAVLLLLAAIILRIVINGKRANDNASYLMCMGMASMLAAQTVINIGMVLQWLPVIGITLPFFSAGGSSNLCVYIGIGLMMSIYRFNQKTPAANFRLQRVVTRFTT